MKPLVSLSSLLVLALICLGMIHGAGQAQETGIIVSDADTVREMDSSVAPPAVGLDARISTAKADSLQFMTLAISSTLTHIPIDNPARISFHGLDAKRDMGLSPLAELGIAVQPRIILSRADTSQTAYLVRPDIVLIDEPPAPTPLLPVTTIPTVTPGPVAIATSPVTAGTIPTSAPADTPTVEGGPAFIEWLKGSWPFCGLAVAVIGIAAIVVFFVVRRGNQPGNVKMACDGREYNIVNIRELLLTAFTPETLKRFCLDRPVFQPVDYEFAPSHGLSDMVDEVIIYCQKNNLFDKLLAEVRKANPGQYAKHGPYSTRAGF